MHRISSSQVAVPNVSFALTFILSWDSVWKLGKSATHWHFPNLIVAPVHATNFDMTMKTTQFDAGSKNLPSICLHWTMDIGQPGYLLFAGRYCHCFMGWELALGGSNPRSCRLFLFCFFPANMRCRVFRLLCHIVHCDQVGGSGRGISRGGRVGANKRKATSGFCRLPPPTCQGRGVVLWYNLRYIIETYILQVG